jgi:hypothetical protein
MISGNHSVLPCLAVIPSRNAALDAIIQFLAHVAFQRYGTKIMLALFSQQKTTQL